MSDQTETPKSLGRMSNPPALGRAELMEEYTHIIDGIELVKIPTRGGWDVCHQCARCGSSVEFIDCPNCDDGFVERDSGDDVCEDLYDVPCDWCNGVGSHPHCISSPEWCEAHPLPGREAIKSTAMRLEAWHDAL